MLFLSLSRALRRFCPGLWIAVCLLAAPAVAVGRDGAAVDLNKECAACHATVSLAGSAHQGLSCAACHKVNLVQGPEAVPHQKTLPAPNCTERCHQERLAGPPGESPAFYPDSVHGRAYLERGVREVAKCWDCHGKHAIRPKNDPESLVNRRNIPVMCSSCHDDQAVVVKFHIHAEKPYQEYLKSVHGRALFEKGLLTFAAVCTDCHGVHDIKGVGQEGLSARRPETCGRCHVLIFDQYRESVHGREALAGNADAPLCIDCHGEHTLMSTADERSPAFRSNVADTCSGCHSRPEIMRKYGVPGDRIETFIESMHGIATGYGSQAAATCASCHGVHDIRPAADPASRVNPAHLTATCGQVDCHPGMPDRIRNQKIHVGPDRKAAPALFAVRSVFLWAVLFLMAVTVVWLVPSVVKRLVGGRKK